MPIGGQSGPVYLQAFLAVNGLPLAYEGAPVVGACAVDIEDECFDTRQVAFAGIGLAAERECCPASGQS
jgi:hypothetical protein